MATALRSSALVGREDEIGVLLRATAAARQGEGQLLLVTGEAGIGKSRLLDEASIAARTTGMRVLVGRAVEEGGPFRPLAEALVAQLRQTAVTESDDLRPFRPALARLLPGWGGGGDAVASVDPVVVLGEGILRLMRLLGEEDGCLLVLEDMHWADRDSLALLDYLADAVLDSRVLVLVAARTDESWSDRLRRLRVHKRVRVLALPRVGAETAARLASGCIPGALLPPEAVEFVVEAAEGLPFLVEELLAGLVESGALAPGPESWTVLGPLTAQVPHTLSELVRSRLDALPPPSRAVLEAAAMLGRDFDWTLLAPITGLSEHEVVDGLRAALSASFLTAEPEVGGGFRWRHALVRDAVLAELIPPEQQALAARAAEALDERDPGHTGPLATLAADLHARGGRPGRAAEHLVQLGRQSMASGAFRLAEELLERAAGLGAGAEATVERVRLLALTGRADEAIAEGEAALLTAAGEARVSLCLSMARAAVENARWDEAEGYLSRAGRRGDPRLDAVAADAAFGAGRVEDAARLAASAVVAAEEQGLPAALCEALDVVGRCARMTDPVSAGAWFRRSADVAEANGLVPWRIRALFGLATAQLLGTVTSGLMAQARELALDAGMVAEVAGIDLILGEEQLLVNGPGAALPIVRRSADLAAGVSLRQVEAMALTLLASIHAAQGGGVEMRARLLEAERLGVRAPDVVAASAGATALAALLDRDQAAACHDLDRGMEGLRHHASSAPLPYWGLWVVLRTALADRDAEARDALRGSAHVARAVNRGGLAYAEAIAAGRAGRLEEADERMAAGDLQLVGYSWWRRLLRLLVFESALTDGWGDPVAGLRTDLDEFDAAGDSRQARACRDLLRAAGVPVPRRGRGDSTVPAELRRVGVTSREVDVLGLVVQGLSNAEVAERLFLSRRTVETHVANLLAKTGVASRSELVRVTGPPA